MADADKTQIPSERKLSTASPPGGPPSELLVPISDAVLALKLATPEAVAAAQAARKELATRDQVVPSLLDYLVETGELKAADAPRVHNLRLVHYYAKRIPGYEISAVLGFGSSGTVFKAKQTRLERLVAVKVLRSDHAANPTLRARFVGEAKAAAQLNHPNIIGCIDMGEVGDTVYMVMELVEGRTVAEIVRERGALDPRVALGIASDVAAALIQAERLGVVHRDVKPDNIMLTRDRVAKLLDLGLAISVLQDELAEGVAVGTPNYMAPEQAMGEKIVDIRADFYALGVCLFFMMTGRTPFSGPPERVMFHHVNTAPPNPLTIRSDLPHSVAALLLRLMAKSPDKRPDSAEKLKAEIDAVLAHLETGGRTPTLAPTPTPIGSQPAPAPIGRSPVMGTPLAPPPPPVGPGGFGGPRLPNPRRRPPIRRGGW